MAAIGQGRVITQLRARMRFIDTSKGFNLVLVLALALLIRLPFIPTNAHVSGDIKIYRNWSERIYRQGLTTIYDTPDVNYPPLLLYYFGGGAWLIAQLPPALTANGAAVNTMIKAPAILADLLTTALLFWALRNQTMARRRTVALLYALNPAIWYISALWGQTDAVNTLFLVAAMLLLMQGAVTPAWIAYALAVGIKGQSVFLAPIIFTLTLARHGVRGLVRGIAAGAIVGALITLPWLLSGRLMLVIQRYSPPSRPWLLVVSAYNIWYVMLWGHVGRFPPTKLLPGLPVSYRVVALAMYAIVVILIVGLLWKDPRRPWMLAVVLLNLGMFLILPQMYERYMFATIVFLLLCAASRWTTRTDAPTDGRPNLWWAYGVLSLTFLINLVIISRFAPTARTDRPTIWQPTLRNAILQGLALLTATTNIVVFCWLSARFLTWRAADRAPDATAARISAAPETGK
jgi:Gpi18-like mannosyltransferase